MDDSVAAQRGRLRQKRMAMACSEAALRLSCPSRKNESELTPLPGPNAPGQTIVGFLDAFPFLLSLAPAPPSSLSSPRYPENAKASTV